MVAVFSVVLSHQRCGVFAVHREAGPLVAFDPPEHSPGEGWRRRYGFRDAVHDKAVVFGEGDLAPQGFGGRGGRRQSEVEQSPSGCGEQCGGE